MKVCEQVKKEHLGTWLYAAVVDLVFIRHRTQLLVCLDAMGFKCDCEQDGT